MVGLFKLYDDGPEEAARAPLARLDKVGHVNSYSVLTLGNGERGHVTEFPFHPNFSVWYQAQGQHHVLDGGDVFAAVQPNSTNDTL